MRHRWAARGGCGRGSLLQTEGPRPAPPGSAAAFRSALPSPLPAHCPVACTTWLQHAGFVAPGQPTSIQDIQAAMRLMDNGCVRSHLLQKSLVIVA